MDEKKVNTEVVIEGDDKDFEEAVNSFENPASVDKKKKKKNGFVALIITLLVAIALVGGILLVIFMPKGQGEEEFEYTDGASIKTEVDDNNVLQIEAQTKDDGTIKTNGSGELLTYVPADIKTMHVQNKKGSFTIESYTPTKTSKETDPETGEKVTTTEATQYTIVGLEGFDLQSGVPDEIASDCSGLSFTKIIETDAKDNLADYGLDKPRSKVKVTYTDGKKAVIYVGNEAPQGIGTYVKFGSNNVVYLCETDSVKPFLYDVTDLISLTINDSASSSGNSDFNYADLTGSAYGNKITLKLNSNTESITNTYVLTSPDSAYADNTEASGVAGAIRGLYASSVACVNPTSAQLSKFGLASTYARVYAKYPDTTVDLIASKPDSKGDCYLMKNNGKVVYKIASSSIPWVTTSYENLLSDYVLSPQLNGLTGIEVSCDSKTYKYTVNNQVVTTTDDDGSTTSSTTTTVKYNGEELTQGYFETYFRNMSLITLADHSVVNPSGSPAFTVKYSYKKKSADTVSFYKCSGNKYTAVLNSKPIGTVYSTYVSKLIDQAPMVAKDKEVKSFW